MPGFQLPNIGSGSSGSSDLIAPFSYTPPKRKKKKNQLTARQIAMLMRAMENEPSRSFGDRLKGIGKGALGGATWTLDKLMRPSWAVAAGVSEALGGESDVKGTDSIAGAAWRGFTGKERKGFGEILDEQGVLEGHGRIRGVAGFGLDVLTDPLMAITAAASVPTGGGAMAAYMAAKTAGRAVTPALVKAAAREAGEKALKGEVDDAVEEVLKAGGKRFENRLALAQHIKTSTLDADLDPWVRKKITSEKNILESMAKGEARIYDPRKLSIGVGTRKHNLMVPTGIPILTRPGAKLAEKNIPVLSQLSDNLGKAFIPGFKNDILNAANLARKHVANNNGLYMRNQLNVVLNGIDPALREDDMLEALHLFEQPLKTTRGGRWKAVRPVKGQPGAYELNPQYIKLLEKQGRLTPSQIDFVQKWHDAAELLIWADREAGVAVEHLGASGRLYVPHVTKKGTDDEIPTVAQHGLLTDAGFQGQRKGAKLSVKQIKEMVERGELPRDIETDPMKLMWRRARAGAELQADMALINSLKASVGVPTRLVDVKRVNRARTRVDTAQAQLDASRRLKAAVEKDTDDALEKARADLEHLHNEALKSIQVKIREARIKGRAKQTTALKNRLTAIRQEIKELRKPTPKRAEPKAKVARAEGAKPKFNATEQRMFKQIAQIRRELDAFDKAKAHPGDLPDSLKKWARYIKGSRKMSRRDRARQFLDRREEKILRRAQARRESATPVKATAKAAPQKAPKPKSKAARIRELQAEVGEIEKALDVLQRRRVPTPGVAKLEAEKLKMRGSFDEAVRALEDPNSETFKKMMKEHINRMDEAKAAERAAKADLAKANDALKKAMRGRRNPAATNDLVESDKVVDEFGNKYRFPKEAANEMMRLERLISGEDAMVENFTRSLNKWMAAWKILVTTVNPGYRIRNTMTDFWNMWVAGVPVWAFGVYGKRSAQLMRRAAIAHKKPTKENMDAVWELMEAANHGILSGLFAGDVQAVARMLKHADDKAVDLFKDGHFVAGYTKLMQDMNRNAENWGRLTHWLYRRQNLGEDIAEASMRTKLAHFDYEDLTPFEQKVMKKFFPFYTWTRKNIPYQVRQILAEPGRYSAFPKMAQEAEYAAGEDSGGIVPDYVERGFGINIGNNEYYMPQFGVSDLSVFQGPDAAWDRLKSMAGPQFKIPAEVMTGKSIFTGADIVPEGHTRVPIAPRGAALLSLLPGSNVGPTARPGPGGEMRGSPGVNPWFSYFGGQIPMGRAALGIGAGTPEKQRSQLLSYFGGQSVQHVDPRQQAYYESLKIQDETDKFLSQLREEGRYPKSKRKKTDFDKLLESVLMGNYGG